MLAVQQEKLNGRKQKYEHTICKQELIRCEWFHTHTRNGLKWLNSLQIYIYIYVYIYTTCVHVAINYLMRLYPHMDMCISVYVYRYIKTYTHNYSARCTYAPLKGDACCRQPDWHRCIPNRLTKLQHFWILKQAGCQGVKLWLTEAKHNQYTILHLDLGLIDSDAFRGDSEK